MAFVSWAASVLTTNILCPWSIVRLLFYYATSLCPLSSTWMYKIFHPICWNSEHIQPGNFPNKLDFAAFLNLFLNFNISTRFWCFYLQNTWSFTVNVIKIAATYTNKYKSMPHEGHFWPSIFNKESYIRVTDLVSNMFISVLKIPGLVFIELRTILPPIIVLAMEFCTENRYVRSEVLMSEMKITVISVVTPCSLETARHFGRKYRFHPQGWRVKQTRNQQNLRSVGLSEEYGVTEGYTLQSAEIFQFITVVTIIIAVVWDLTYSEIGRSSFLRKVCKPLLYPEDGGGTTLRNVIKSLFYPESVSRIFLRNVGKLPPDCMSSHPRRQQPSKPLRWESQILHST
jgi:hypothetical protein